MARNEQVMLAMAGDETKLDEMIASGNWQFEVKFDGERGKLCKSGNKIELINRRGKDIGSQFPELIEMAKSLPDGVFDGEIYVPANEADKDKPTTGGRTNVNPKDALILSKIKPAVFKCWDVLKWEDHYVVDKTYEERKELLGRVDSLHITGFDGVFPEEDPRKAWDEIVAGGNEGMVAKRVGSGYQFTRSSDWVKLKTWQENDFEVIGFTSDKREISALIVKGGLKVNCSLNAEQYGKLLGELIKGEEAIKCQDGTIGTAIKNHYTAKIKYLSKTDTGLRFPILRELS